MGTVMSARLPEVLIVDDSATVRASLKKFLGDGYIKHTAEDGEQGWDILVENENIALVLADMHMPVLNGMLLLQRIRNSDEERIASVPVVMITGVDDTRAAKRAAHTIGASDFIGKPFDMEHIQKVADSFTRLDRRMSEYSAESKHNWLTGLDNNRSLLDFGKKSIAYAREMQTDTAILYAEIVETQTIIETHGSRIAEQIVSKIHAILQESTRKDEMLTRIDDGKFVLVLPMTKAFKAHIVASRLKKAARSIEFDTGSAKIRVNLAIGLTSTESCDDSIDLEFKDYCIQSALALKMSRETENHPTVRYDETYEKQFEDLTVVVESNKVEDEAVDASLEVFGEFFSGILVGDYSGIPDSYLPNLIDPIDKFLEYARDKTEPASDSEGDAASEAA